MICFPTAKINLGLRVVEKRPDGYHNIETFFYPIGLKDALEIVPAKGLSDFQLTVSGTQEVIEPASNLVTKAYRLMQEVYTLPVFDTYLHKAIPTGAGLGGGSSDAAYMLMLLNQWLDSGISGDELMEKAARLGADCPFFLLNKPVYATGTGNQFEDTSLSLKGYYLVVVKPQVSVSTAEAYAQMKPHQRTRSLKEMAECPVSEWKTWVENDFEAYAFQIHPVIGEIKQRLYDNGALYASMSGSGSAVFGIFQEAVDCSAVFPGCFYWSEKL
jgi:4-diphosphocytidyl-2-C-methyl-D-erythritol kinase